MSADYYLELALLTREAAASLRILKQNAKLGAQPLAQLHQQSAAPKLVAPKIYEPFRYPNKVQGLPLVTKCHVNQQRKALHENSITTTPVLSTENSKIFIIPESIPITIPFNGLEGDVAKDL